MNFDKSYRKFMIYKDYFIGEYGDDLEGKIDIIGIKTKDLQYCILNNIIFGIFNDFYTISFGENYKDILIERSIDKNTIIDSISLNCRAIFEFDKVITFECYLSPESKNDSLNYDLIDLNNNNRETKVISVNKEDDLLCVFQKYYLALNDEGIYIAENKTGRKIIDWKIVVDRFFKGRIFQNRLFLYDWLNEVDADEIDGKKFVFIRQVIEFPDFIKEETYGKNIMIEDPR
jgi:hypothetical protein